MPEQHYTKISWSINKKTCLKWKRAQVGEVEVIRIV